MTTLPIPRITLTPKPDPMEAGEMLRHYFAKGLDDVIELAPGVYGFDKRLVFPNGTKLCGMRAAAVRLVSSATASAEGCVFELNDGVVLAGLTLDARTNDPGCQNQVVGMANNQNGCTAWLSDCTVAGRSFGVYVWALPDNTLELRRCNISVGRWGITAGGSSGFNAQFIRCIDCNVLSDFELNRGGGGSIGDGSVCLVARGGVIEFTGGSLSAKGSAMKDAHGRPFISRVHCAWTTPQPGSYEGSKTWPAIRLSKVATAVQANGSEIVSVVNQQIGTITQE